MRLALRILRQRPCLKWLKWQLRCWHQGSRGAAWLESHLSTELRKLRGQQVAEVLNKLTYESPSGELVYRAQDLRHEALSMCFGSLRKVRP